MTLANRILRILKTKLGERVGMPTYGSELYKLRDRGLTPETRLLFVKYCKEAIEKWEDVKVTKAQIQSVDASTGAFSFLITLDNSETIEGAA
jgi:uncharacterized protein